MPAPRLKILIVDDEPHMRRSLEILLSDDERFDAATAPDGRAALAKLSPDTALVIADLTMPVMNGVELLKQIKRRQPHTQVVLMTAYSTVQSAIEALKAGAFEYLIKPFDNDNLLQVADRAVRVAQMQAPEMPAAGTPSALERIIGKSPAITKLREVIRRCAATGATVLVTGESGTGKELIARAIHGESPRAAKPFVAVNCAALPETLLESELFGHERGAFTDAVRSRQGLLDQAHGGTLFLDEIGDMSLPLQAKFLRVLEDQQFQRIGGEKPVVVDVRFIAATNKNLDEARRTGYFREDLFYRLNVLHLATPPLRERREDIRPLVDHFLRLKAQALGRKDIDLSPEAEALLLSHDYPGNIRELENVIERAVVLCQNGVIDPADLPFGQRASEPAGNLDLTWLDDVHQLEGAWQRIAGLAKELERRVIELALIRYGNLSNGEIAQILGTSRRVFELRLQEFALDKAGTRPRRPPP